MDKIVKDSTFTIRDDDTDTQTDKKRGQQFKTKYIKLQKNNPRMYKP